MSNPSKTYQDLADKTQKPESNSVFIRGNQNNKGYTIKTQGGVMKSTISTNYSSYQDGDYWVNPVSGITSFSSGVFNKPFVPADIKPVGCHFIMGGGGVFNRMNREVYEINPTLAQNQQNGQVVSNLNETLYRQTVREYDKVICRNYGEFFEMHVRNALDWLAPEIVSGTQSDNCAYLHFHIPHGKIMDMNPYAHLETQEREQHYLYDNFYERCAGLRKIGVRCMAHNASPEHYFETKSIEDPRIDDLFNLYNKARLTAGFDAATSYASGGLTWQLAYRYSGDNYGIMIEGIPSPTLHPHWVNSKLPMAVFGDPTTARIAAGYYSGNQNGNYVGKWPVAGTTGFQNAYGDTWIFMQMEANSFNLITQGYNPDGAATGVSGVNAWISGFASGCRNLVTQIGLTAPSTPKIVILLPYYLISRIQKVGGRAIISPQAFSTRTY